MLANRYDDASSRFRAESLMEKRAANNSTEINPHGNLLQDAFRFCTLMFNLHLVRFFSFCLIIFTSIALAILFVFKGSTRVRYDLFEPFMPSHFPSFMLSRAYLSILFSLVPFLLFTVLFSWWLSANDVSRTIFFEDVDV